MTDFTILEKAQTIASNALEDMRKVLGRGGSAHLPGEIQAQNAITEWLMRIGDIATVIDLQSGNGPVREMPVTTAHPMANELEELKATIEALREYGSIEIQPIEKEPLS